MPNKANGCGVLDADGWIIRFFHRFLRNSAVILHLLFFLIFFLDVVCLVHEEETNM